MIYILNSYNAVCQFYLIKARKTIVNLKKKRKSLASLED